MKRDIFQPKFIRKENGLVDNFWRIFLIFAMVVSVLGVVAALILSEWHDAYRQLSFGVTAYLFTHYIRLLDRYEPFVPVVVKHKIKWIEEKRITHV